MTISSAEAASPRVRVVAGSGVVDAQVANDEPVLEVDLDLIGIQIEVGGDLGVQDHEHLFVDRDRIDPALEEQGGSEHNAEDEEHDAASERD